MIRLSIETPLTDAVPGLAVALPFFHLGAKVPCSIVVESDENGSLDGLELRLLELGHGSGSPSVRPVRTVPLPRLELEAGRPVRWSTELPLPAEGPPSYCGEHVKLDWELSVGPREGAGPRARLRLWVRPARAAAG